MERQLEWRERCLKGGINDVTNYALRVLVTVPHLALTSSLPLWAELTKVLAFLPLSIPRKIFFNYEDIFIISSFIFREVRTEAVGRVACGQSA